MILLKTKILARYR